jgi:hypothetical protein
MHALIFSYIEKDSFSKRFHNVESSLRGLLRKGIGYEKVSYWFGFNHSHS